MNKRSVPTRKLLLIEDDPFVVEWICRLVDSEFKGRIKVLHVDCEAEFVSRFQELSAHTWLAAIVDCFIPWDSGMMARADTLEPRGEYYKAGIRILSDFATDAGLSLVPVLFYSVEDTERIDLPDLKLDVEHLRKDAPDQELVSWLHRVGKRRYPAGAFNSEVRTPS